MPSFCSYFNSAHCRSCSWIERPYSEQLTLKEMKIREALSFFTEPFLLEKSVESTLQGFRDRAKMVVTGTVEKPIIGLLGETALDEGRELLACPIHHPRLNELIAALPGHIRSHDLAPYRIGARAGELKGLIAFHSPFSGEMYLRFVLRSQVCVARIRTLLPALQREFPELVCVSANIQPVPHAILEGPEEIILTERRAIDHQIGTLRLSLSPQAFVQTNTQVAAELYQTAARWVEEVRPGKMLELYCGQGAFSFFSAQGAGEILGIEINADAVATAAETARRLGFGNLTFKSLDARKVEDEFERFSPDLILANPPRRGLAEGVELLKRFLPAHILYSSCAIETLAGDLEKLAGHYRLKRAQLFDMFPHTEHFETLVWLERRVTRNPQEIP